MVAMFASGSLPWIPAAISTLGPLPFPNFNTTEPCLTISNMSLLNSVRGIFALISGFCSTSPPTAVSRIMMVVKFMVVNSDGLPAKSVTLPGCRVKIYFVLDFRLGWVMVRTVPLMDVPMATGLPSSSLSSISPLPILMDSLKVTVIFLKVVTFNTPFLGLVPVTWGGVVSRVMFRGKVPLTR